MYKIPRSSRAKTNIKNKFENRAQGSATGVFHQLLCLSIVLCKIISECHCHVFCCCCAKLLLILIGLRCNFKCLASSVMTHRARVVFFVPYLNPLVASVSKFSIFIHCALLCRKKSYQYLLSTFIILDYFWYLMYSFLLKDLLNSAQDTRNHINIVINIVTVKPKNA